ncbi:claudin-23-like [Esox lucius]|uniref:Claudin 23a n=1 Tax=Esox lucius TaxID=8010 RepID=A0AAY5KGB4_ESOLU|nr:claudin-23-like [Esox lucius]
MPGNTEEWIRTSRRTPGIFIFGMVLSPCGLLLDLIATVAPNWRTINTIAGRPTDTYLEQGIWDMCQASASSQTVQCNQPDTIYFQNQIIPIAQGLMVASLIVTLIGLGTAIPGVRCWRDHPNWVVAGLGGLIIFLSGVLTIIPIAWYTNILQNITATTTSNDIRVGYCIVLGYIGGIFEVLGGIVMVVGMCRCCGGKNRGETHVVENTAHFRHTKPPPRRIEVPSISRTRSTASSVPYSQDSMAEEVDFPRAKTTSYGGRKPAYDADL